MSCFSMHHGTDTEGVTIAMGRSATSMGRTGAWVGVRGGGGSGGEEEGNGGGGVGVWCVVVVVVVTRVPVDMTTVRNPSPERLTP